MKIGDSVIIIDKNPWVPKGTIGNIEEIEKTGCFILHSNGKRNWLHHYRFTVLSFNEYLCLLNKD